MKMKLLIGLLALASAPLFADDNFGETKSDFQINQEKKRNELVGKVFWVYPENCKKYGGFPPDLKGPAGISYKQLNSGPPYKISVISVFKNAGPFYSYELKINDSLDGFIDSALAAMSFGFEKYAERYQTADHACQIDIGPDELAQARENQLKTQAQKMQTASAQYEKVHKNTPVFGISVGRPVDSFPECYLEQDETRVCTYIDPKMSIVALRPTRPSWVTSNAILSVKDGLIASFYVRTNGVEGQDEAFNYLVRLLGKPAHRTLVPKQNLLGARFISITADWTTKDKVAVFFDGIDKKFDEGSISVIK